MLFYLSSVEEGGESTFPVADNRTYDEQVNSDLCSSICMKHFYGMQPSLDTSRLLIMCILGSGPGWS